MADQYDIATVSAMALGRWEYLLPSFGIDSRFIHLGPDGPCPLCNGKSRFKMKDIQTGSWFCNQCRGGDGFELVKRFKSWTFPQTKEEIAKACGALPEATPVRPAKDAADKAAYMRKLCIEGLNVVAGDPVYKYLTNRCGEVDWSIMRDIRYHPDLPHSLERKNYPAMLAILRDNHNKGLGLQRVYLTMDGHKAEANPVRMTLGEVGVLRLGAPQRVLGIAEGIETAMCASRLFQVPCWAAISANGLENFEPPPGIEEVIVFADNDHSFTGQRAAFILAFNLKKKGFKVRVEMPLTMGEDFADILTRREE